MGAVTDAIKIDGLSQFAKAIKDIDADLPKTLRIGLNKVADTVVSVARPRIPSRSGKARASLKAASLKDKVRVRAGGNKARHYPWLDFGGEGRVKGRPPARPFLKQGRYLYPAYYAKRDSGEFGLILTTVLLDVVKAAGIEVD